MENIDNEKPHLKRYDPARHYTDAVIRYSYNKESNTVNVAIQKIGEDKFYSFSIGRKAYNRMLINLLDSRLV